MFRSSRKVKPEDNELSSDSEGISSLAYTFRGARNSRISRLFHKQEIQFIEKRFQDTALLIFKDSDHEFMDNSKQEVDGMNALLLRNSYKAAFDLTLWQLEEETSNPARFNATNTL
ncbi:hypothetical protein Ocin01_19896 [Orchesella cincta]|uniref:Uncharacterized protein n=1 Tax=Orchesella cincta TaxID=48709 RepID=A0A1D2M1D8_ORCCI|nr:hypothetical protein Ocin01_19896 [Orchesella cincta]